MSEDNGQSVVDEMGLDYLKGQLYTGAWDCTSTEYHRDRRCESHSTLEVFRGSVPMYHGRFVLETLPHPPSSQSQLLGSAFHIYLLERDKWSELVALIPDFKRTTKAGREDYEKWLQEITDSMKDPILITQEQFLKVEAMAGSALQNGEVRRLLEADGVTERGYRWQDQDTGIWLKCRPDKLFADGDIMDLKTADDPSPDGFGRACARYGYHRQAALYQDGRYRALDLNGFHVHLVTGTSPPFETVVYQLDEEDIELGRRQNRETLNRLRDCRQFDSWASRWADRVHRVRLPRWAHFEEPEDTAESPAV